MNLPTFHFNIQGARLWSIKWEELQTHEGLEKLDTAFLDWLAVTDVSLYERLIVYRSGVHTRVEQSLLIMSLAPVLEAFWLQGFSMHEAYAPLQKALQDEEPVLAFRKWAVRAIKTVADVDKHTWLDLDAVWSEKLNHQDDHEKFIATQWFESDDKVRSELLIWLVGSLHETPDQFREWASLEGPKRLDWNALFQSKVDDTGVRVHFMPKARPSLFDLSDDGYSLRKTQMETDYCVYCHKNQGDYCSIGFLNKKGQPELGVRENPLGELSDGCPLEQHISEMNLLRRRGHVFAALATVMVENPLCCLTGHRICNGCSLACIYQKQEPVDIPHIETRTLKDILNLPWGIEWYLLLLMWNPLRSTQYLPKRSINKRAAVMGLGPSGIASLHHLWMEGVDVVGFDGLTIMAAPSQWVGSPLYDRHDWWEPLSERQQKGFGGVAEYGITVRWDKNFLKLPWLAFARRNILLMGGVRFGGTLTVDDVWDMGFQHLVLALGAGLPHALNIPQSLAKGMRSANDFLMNLHLQGANRSSPLTLMDIRMPAVVIGGGLTSVDAATELQAYYVHLVTNVKKIVDSLSGDADFWSRWSLVDQTILKEWYGHAVSLKSGMSKEELISRLGGVLMVYRRTMQQSPSYRTNAYELDVAMQEGVKMLELHVPERVTVDAWGRVSALQLRHVESNKEQTVFARTILLAIGSQPNVAYEYEHSGTFSKHSNYYTPHSGVVKLQAELEPALFHQSDPRMLTSYQQRGYRVSFVGDLHPQFHGSVVKALASAKKAYPQILEALRLVAQDKEDLNINLPYVSSIEWLSHDLLRLSIHSPMHAKNATCGQFFRIHPFLHVNVEAMPLTLYEKEGDHLVFIVRVVGVSTEYLSRLVVGESIAIMGPTGVRMRMDDISEVTCVVCDVAGLPSGCALARQMKQQGLRVYLAYQCGSPSEGAWLKSLLPEFDGSWDMTHEKDWVLSFGNAPFDFSSIQRVVLQGMAGFLKKARSLREPGAVHPEFQPKRYLGSVFGPMQCMLKGVCAECWQWQVDPVTQERTKAVFACSWQDQPLEMIDMDHLESRQTSNQLLDRLVKMYVQSGLHREL